MIKTNLLCTIYIDATDEKNRIVMFATRAFLKIYKFKKSKRAMDEKIEFIEFANENEDGTCVSDYSRFEISKYIPEKGE